MSPARPNTWKVAFWAQFVLWVAVLLAVMDGARARLATLQEARRQAAAARELAERLRAQQVAASEQKPVILEGPIVEIIDGDTVTVQMGSHEYRIRLHGIDCPELDQPYGVEASSLVGQLVDSDEVQVRLTDVDRYGRLVGVVSLDGRSINLELVEAGFAWWSEKYAPDDEQLAEAEKEARAERRGLWVDADAVSPWEWRRGKTAKRPATPSREGNGGVR